MAFGSLGRHSVSLSSNAEFLLRGLRERRGGVRPWDIVAVNSIIIREQ